MARGVPEFPMAFLRRTRSPGEAVIHEADGWRRQNPPHVPFALFADALDINHVFKCSELFGQDSPVSL